MSIIFLLIPLSVVIATGFLIAFIWAVRSGQYEDTCTPSMRLLLPDGIRESGKAGFQSATAKAAAPVGQRIIVSRRDPGDSAALSAANQSAAALGIPKESALPSIHNEP